MAPALSEPLSPTDKLSKSAATSVPVTRSTRRSRAAAAAAAAEVTVGDTAKTQPIAEIKTTTCTVGNKERKTRRNSSAAAATTTTTASAVVAEIPVTAKTTATTRVTRSKDNANQRISEQAAIPAESNSPQAANSSSSTSTSSKKKEPMAISAAPDTSNNNPQTSTASKKDEANKGDSTEKILADLATNIEEAISAEICLRKQLCDVNISNEEAAKKTNGGTELKDIDFIINSSDGGAVEQEVAEDDNSQQQYMDPVLQTIQNDTLEPAREIDDLKYREELPTTECRGNVLADSTNSHLDALAEIIRNEEQLLQQGKNEEIVKTTAVNNEEITRTTTTNTATNIDSCDDGYNDTLEGK